MDIFVATEDPRADDVRRLLETHREGYARVSLETGSTDDFAPARTLHAKVGFRPCPPFGDYDASAHNTFMTLSLHPAPGSSLGEIPPPTLGPPR